MPGVVEADGREPRLLEERFIVAVLAVLGVQGRASSPWRTLLPYVGSSPLPS